MLYVAKLKTNILGSGPEEVALAPHTFVVAPNGGGKTRITTALGLLLTGSADDLLGKEDPIKSSGELLTLAPFGDERLLCEASIVGPEGASEEVMSYTIDGTGGTARHAVEVRPTYVGAWSFPVRQVGHALWSGPKTARDFFSRFLGESASAEDIQRKIPEEFWSPPQTGGRNPRSVAELVRFIESAQGSAKDESAAERGHDAAAAEAANGLPAEPTDAEVAASSIAINRAQDLLRQAQAGARYQQACGEVHRLTTFVQQTEAAIADAEMRLGPDPQPANPKQARVGAMAHSLVQILEQWAEFQSPTCVCCGVPQTLEQLHVKTVEYQTLASNVDRGLADYRAMMTRREAVKQQISTARVQVANARSQLAVWQQEVAQPVTTTHTDAEAAAAMQGAIQHAHSLESIRGRHAAVRASRNLAREAKRLAAWWKEYTGVLKEALQEVMSHGAERFRDRVQGYLPEEYRLALVLRDGNRDVFRVGLERNGAVHLALSGAEKTIVEFALTAACLDLLPENEKPKFAVLCPWEERAIDAENGQRLMKALGNLPYQIVLYSIVAPLRPPKGWGILDLSPPKKARAKKAAGEKDGEAAGEKDGEAPAEKGEAPAETAPVPVAPAAPEVQALLRMAHARVLAHLEEYANLRLQLGWPPNEEALFRSAGVPRYDVLEVPFERPDHQINPDDLARLDQTVNEALADARAEVVHRSTAVPPVAAPAPVETAPAPVETAPAMVPAAPDVPAFLAGLLSSLRALDA